MFDHRAIVKGSLERFGDSLIMPAHIQPSFDHMERHVETQRTRQATAEQAQQWFKIRDAVDQKLERFSDRRLAELEIAKYIETQVLPLSPQDEKLYRLPAAMSVCHESGIYGCRENGHHVVAWDAKCDIGCLCPHESREETKRLARRYIPQLSAQINKGLRPYYAVFTMPNFQPGQLKRGQKLIYKRWNALLKKRRPRKLGGGKLFPIAGSICVLEAPLAYDGTWNVHLNVIMLCDGYLDYEQVRRAWYWNVDFQDQRTMFKKTEQRMRWKAEHTGVPMPDLTPELVLTQAMLELIKYTVATVPEKNGPKAGGHWQGNVYLDGQGGHQAPPLTHWPAGSFIEWWEAQQRFRRTRTYGKRVLFAALDKEEPETDAGLKAVTWLGTIKWMRDGGYRTTAPLVDLIPGHNSDTPRVEWEQRPPPICAHEELMGKVERISSNFGNMT